MGTYRVNPDGRAPSGLGIGDAVVTGGGVYLITGFNADGSYISTLLDKKTTTYNYTGTYDTINNDTFSNNTSNNTATGLPGSTDKEASRGKNGPYHHIGGANADIWDIQGSGNGSSTGGNSSTNINANINANTNSNGYGSYPGVSLPDINVMTFEEAMALAKDVMEPEFTAATTEATRIANENLERAGLYDTVYGQALAASSRNSVAADVNSAIVGLALELSNASADQAQHILELAVKEKQFAADYDAERKSEAMDYLMKLLQQ